MVVVIVVVLPRATTKVNAQDFAGHGERKVMPRMPQNSSVRSRDGVAAISRKERKKLGYSDFPAACVAFIG